MIKARCMDYRSDKNYGDIDFVALPRQGETVRMDGYEHDVRVVEHFPNQTAAPTVTIYLEQRQ